MPVGKAVNIRTIPYYTGKIQTLDYFLLSIQGANIMKSLILEKRYLVNSCWSSEVCILRQISIKIRSEINPINSWRNRSFQQIHDMRNQLSFPQMNFSEFSKFSESWLNPRAVWLLETFYIWRKLHSLI